MTKTIIKQIKNSNLKNAQIAFTKYGQIPKEFQVPTPEQMKLGDYVCDHSCDVEHEQTINNKKFITSVIWTTDSGCGIFPLNTIIGNQWLTTIKEVHEPICTWDNGLTDLAELILDCDINTEPNIAIQESITLLKQLLKENS